MRTFKTFIVVAISIIVTMIGGGTPVSAEIPSSVSIVVLENVGVSELKNSHSPLAVDIEESISVADSAILTGPAIIHVTETVAVADDGGVINSAPIVDAGPPLTVDEGSPAILAASVIVLDPQLATATVDWGDGTSDQVIPTTAGEISATHLYTDEGVYDVLVTVAGLFGDQGFDTTQIEVVNAAPQVDAGGPYAGNTDEAIVVSAIGDDPGGDPVTYAWDLDDDGEFDDGNAQSVLFSSSTPGTFPVAVEIQDDSGESAQAIAQVVISAVVSPDDSSDGSGSGSPSGTPEITSPASGSTLSAQETFEWTSNGADVAAWYLRIGTSPGARDIYNGSPMLPTVLSATTLLSGSTIYVSLLYLEATTGWTEISEIYTGPGVAPTLDGIPPSNPSLLLSSRNSTTGRPFQEGDAIVLRATIQPGPGPFTIPVDNLDFTLNGLPLPSPAFAIASPNGSYQAFLGMNVATAGEVLEFGAIAYDAAGNVIATASLTIVVEDSSPSLQLNLIGPTTLFEDSVGRYEVMGFNTNGQPVTYRFLQDGLIVSTGSSAVVLNPNRQPILPTPGFELTVVGIDWLGRSTTASIDVQVLSRDEDGEPDGSAQRDDTDRAEPDGRVSGRAVIGRLVQMSSTLIIVNARVGADFTDVQIHIDPASTRLSEKLDAESYTRGSRVVVVADGDVLSGNATALKIAPIPGTAVRRHDRALVSKPKDGDAANLVGADDGRRDSVVKDEDGNLDDGDQVVVLVRRDDSNRRNEKPKIIDVDDVKNRLNEYAQRKFDDGDTDATGRIDRLAKERIDKEQERIDRAKRHADEAVRRAAELADEKARRAAEKDAADPVKAIRRNTVSDSESEILRCAARVVGRTVSGESDLSADELRRVTVDCLGGDGDGRGGIPDRVDDGQRNSPPPEILDCIVRVLGSVPNRPITDEEEVRLKAACSFDDADNANEDDKSDRERKDERNSTKEVDARKIAFCASNPEDPHCAGGPSGSSGDKSGSSGSDAEKRAFCTANPTDSRCIGDAGGNGNSDNKNGDPGSDAEKRAFCAANPGDSRCTGDTGGGDSKKDVGTKPPGK